MRGDGGALVRGRERAAYRDLNVLRWLGAYTASVTGDVAYYLTLSWAVAQVAGPATVGVVLAVGAIPRAVLMLGGGVLADRFGPRRVLIASDLVRCAVVLAVAVLTYAQGPRLLPLCVLAFVFGVVDAVFMPAVGAVPPRLTGSGQLARVQGMRSLAVRLSNAVGPLIAASVLAARGPGAAFGVVALLFVASLGLLTAVRVRPTASPDVPEAAPDAPDVPDNSPGVPEIAPRKGAPGPWADLRDGLRHLRRHRRLSRLVLVVALGEMCFSGPLAAGLVLLADERAWGPTALGGVLTAFSVGGAVTGLALTAARRVPHAGAALAGSLVVTGILVTALGQAGTPGAAMALGAVVGAASGVCGAIGHALVQQRTEPRYLGRVTSVTTLGTLGLSPLLYPVTGLVAAAWGTGVFFTACGAVCALAAAVGLTSAVRTAEL
ncbi:MFS transporter [Streptomyces sp. NPDC058001]|uniref:MFS transporter n=1 Tax=Streptomyces sp. NPDC058001 TaxID=3346300 RepID=UPI0036EF0C21